MINQAMSNLGLLCKHWLAYVISGVVFVIAGLWVFQAPIDILAITLGFVFGISFTIYGAVYSISTFRSRKEAIGWGWSLACGLITLVLGLYLLVHPLLSSEVFVLYVGFSLLISCLGIVGHGYEMHKHKAHGAFWTLLFGVIGCIVSMLIVLFPGAAYFGILVWLALGLITSGISAVFLGFSMHKVNKELAESAA